MRALGGALFFAAAAAGPAGGAELNKLAVLDLRTEGVDQITANNLTTLVAVELQALGVFQVITREDISAQLAFDKQRQLMGCESDVDCIAEIGGALGVDRIVSGKVGQIGDTYVLSLTLQNRKAQVEARSTRQATGKDALIAETKRAVQELTSKVLQELSGFVEVRVNQADAELRLDGKLVGVAPGPPVRFGAGPHELRVSKKGYVDHAHEIVIPQAQQTVAVDVVLVPSPEFVAEYERNAGLARLWAWSATGVAAATGIAGGFFYVSALGNAGENSRALAAAEDARGRGDTPAFERESGIVAQTQSAGEFQRTMAIGMGTAALLSAGVAAYFWLTGDPPDRYQAAGE